MNKLLRNMTITCLIFGAALSYGQKSHAKITPAQASKTALARYHGVVVGKVVLENEDGKWQYAVNVRSGKTMREVMVDSHTGKIASVEITTAKEEKEEAKAEKNKAKRGSKPVKHKTG